MERVQKYVSQSLSYIPDAANIGLICKFDGIFLFLFLVCSIQDLIEEKSLNVGKKLIVKFFLFGCFVLFLAFSQNVAIYELGLQFTTCADIFDGN